MARPTGFSLVEVLIALVVIAAGLLGLAKMQALSLSATKNAGSRGLIALQTESLADLMHANQAFWASGQAPASFTVAGTSVTDATHVLDVAVANCQSRCTPARLAAFDLHTWAADMNEQFPSYAAKVNCSTDASTPINCIIYVTWSEKSVAINRNSATGSATQVTTESFSVYVKP
ncbi:MAG: type IV pilus modification protein PilV [Janthinobacterium lividum]